MKELEIDISGIPLESVVHVHVENNLPRGHALTIVEALAAKVKEHAPDNSFVFLMTMGSHKIVATKDKAVVVGFNDVVDGLFELTYYDANAVDCITYRISGDLDQKYIMSFIDNMNEKIQAAHPHIGVNLELI
ncbi:hypothetical protein VPHK469_0050 [Vibrio phage K469]